jgi:hypothetical protein
MSSNKNKLVESRVSKIAILNPYLQGGHTQTAEIESATRFIQAAETMGIEARMLASSNDVASFDPDFIIPITYQEPKLTPYPTYGLLTMPVSWVKDSARFVRNILSYDGYLTVSTSVIQWLMKICHAHNKNPYIAQAAFSVQQISLPPCQFARAKAIYLGTNWDKTRHKDLFSHLSDGAYLKCFGPRQSWSMYPATLYGGEIPFDGTSSLKVYNEYAAGLCVNHPDFDQEGIPSSRTFEIAAAGALPICMPNEYTENMLGDSVLYLSKTDNVAELAEQIIEAVHWIRLNSHRAAEMAEQAHHIFNSQMSMQVFLNNVLQMHQKVVASNEESLVTSWKINQYTQSNDNTATITYFIKMDNTNDCIKATLQSIYQQTHSNINIIILGTTEYQNIVSDINQHSNLIYLNMRSSDFYKSMVNILQENKTRWFGILTPNDILLPNHVSFMLKSISNSSSHHRIAICSGSLFYSTTQQLLDDIIDESSIPNNTKIKIGYFPLSTAIENESIPRHTCLFNFSYFNHGTFDTKYLKLILESEEIKKDIFPNGSYDYCCGITTSKNVVSILQKPATYGREKETTSWN